MKLLCASGLLSAVVKKVESPDVLQRATSSTFKSSFFAMQIIRFREKEAAKFVTPSGVTAVVATDLDPRLIHALKRKLQRKLRRRGFLSSDVR